MNLEEINELVKNLSNKGYKKYIQNHRSEDYAYWKSFNGYQVGVLAYDFTKYSTKHILNNDIKISFECMLVDIDSRCELIVTNEDMSLDKFEDMSLKFYQSIKEFM